MIRPSIDLIRNFTVHEEEEGRMKWVSLRYLSPKMRVWLMFQMAREGWQKYYVYGGDVVIVKFQEET